MENEIGRACSKYGREEKFWSDNLKEGDHFEDSGIDGRIKL
jgi:hypothetical protein